MNIEKIYIVVVHQVDDCAEIALSIKPFSSIDKAKEHFNSIVEDERNHANKNDWKIKMDNDACFCSIGDGGYYENHSLVELREEDINWIHQLKNLLIMGLYDAEYIIVNGVRMSMDDYKKVIKEKKSKLKIKKPKKVLTEINLLPSDIKEMMKKVKLIKSLSAYYDNGYKQWGNVAKFIINLDEIRKPFVLYRAKAREIQKTMEEISAISKRNDKSVFQYIRTLSYQLDDLCTQMDLLFKGVSRSGVVAHYANHECIIGCGRRLGLQTLMSRSWSATKELNDIIKRCQAISDKGTD